MVKPDIKDFQLNESQVDFILKFPRLIREKTKFFEKLLKTISFVLIFIATVFCFFYVFNINILKIKTYDFILFVVWFYILLWPVLFLYTLVTELNLFRSLISKGESYLKKRYLSQDNISIFEYEKLNQSWLLYQKKLAEYGEFLKIEEHRLEETRIKDEKDKEESEILKYVEELKQCIELVKYKRDYEFINSVYLKFRFSFNVYEEKLNGYKYFWADYITHKSFFKNSMQWMEDKLIKTSPITPETNENGLLSDNKAETDNVLSNILLVNVSDVFSDAPKNEIKKKRVQGISSKKDFIAKNIINVNIGLLGEEFIMNYEKDRLNKLGKVELAKNVRHISKIDGDGAGYDILSFKENGEELFIEVKTTTDELSTQFFITSNELSVLSTKKNYSIYRVFNFNPETKTGSILKIEGKNQIEKYFNLVPINFSVTPKNDRAQ